VPTILKLLDGCRVFVVEDEFLIGVTLREMLSEHGATVIGPYGQPSQALRRAIEDGFDVGIIDIDIDIDIFGVPAYDVADELRRQGIPFAFATGTRPKISRSGSRTSRAGASHCSTAWSSMDSRVSVRRPTAFRAFSSEVVSGSRDGSGTIQADGAISVNRRSWTSH